jgi:hypothetical protein
MRRAELFIWGDKRKGERQYEMAKAGKMLAGSMSCKVPFDVCTCCEKKAKSSALYCEHLKYSMGKFLPEFQKFAYAQNPEPNFFDYSDVKNNADRIALRLEYLFPPGELAKAASFGQPVNFPFSDLLAKRAGLLLPAESLLGCSTSARRGWLEKLAAQEDYIQACDRHPDLVAKDEKFHFLKHAAQHAFPAAPTDGQMAAMRTVDPGVLFGRLAKEGAVLPFRAFFSYVTGLKNDEVQKSAAYQYAAARLLPNLFQDTLNAPADPALEEYFVPASQIKRASCPADDPVEKVMDQVGGDYSMRRPVMRVRIMRICAEYPGPAASSCDWKKSASSATPDDVASAKANAFAYAMYKVAFCEAAAEFGLADSVDDAGLLLVVSQNKN